MLIKLPRNKRGLGPNIVARRQSSMRTKQNNPAKTLYKLARHRASLKKQDFSIEVQDIVFPEFCPYLGIPLTWKQGQGYVPSNYSLDRIDSTKGYVKGNIQITSRLANAMKQNATKEQLIAFAKGVLALHE